MSLFDATSAADVRAALAAGENIEQRTRFGRTPLILAAALGHAEVVLALIAAGARTNASDVMQMSALHYAVWNNSRDMVEALLAADADVDAPAELGETPIFRARDADVLTMLLAAGADIGVRHSWTNMMPLGTFICLRRWNCALLLLHRGADVSDSRLLFEVVRRLS